MQVGEWTKDGEWTASKQLNEIYRNIRALGLETNLAELEVFGFTVIPDALDPDEVAALRSVILEVTSTRIGQNLDLDHESGFKGLQFVPYLLFKDAAFERALLNPRPLALITYLLGQSCWLSSMGSHVKGPGGDGLVLHSDNGNGMVAPFPPYAQVANCNYALTDYTREGGAFAVVPGSHRTARPPTAAEMILAGDNCNPHAVPVEVPAGSAIVWHGNTWHGSFPRLVPGLRINLSTYFCRQFIAPQELYADSLPAGFMARHGEDSRMAQLLGLNHFNGWRDNGPSYHNPRAFRAGRNWAS